MSHQSNNTFPERGGMRHRSYQPPRTPDDWLFGKEWVWDYPRPPRVESVSKLIVVEFGGIRLAESSRALRVLETASPPVYYLPPEYVLRDHLEPSDHRSSCEWKGTARYWSVRVGERYSDRAAWSYPDPIPPFEAIRDQLAFYAGRMDRCTVGDMEATPQSGSFYGGWITPDIVGPFKGDPGTLLW